MTFNTASRPTLIGASASWSKATCYTTPTWRWWTTLTKASPAPTKRHRGKSASASWRNITASSARCFTIFGLFSGQSSSDNLLYAMATSCLCRGNALPSLWQCFAIALARSCHNGGKVVPSRWHSCAKPKKKFGTRGVLLTGVNTYFRERLASISIVRRNEIHIVRTIR